MQKTRDAGSIPGSRSSGGGHSSSLQYSCLENPMDRGAWRASIHGVTQSRTRLKWLSSSSKNSVVTLLGQEVKHHNVITQAIYFKDLYWSLKQKDVLSESRCELHSHRGYWSLWCTGCSWTKGWTPEGLWTCLSLSFLIFTKRVEGIFALLFSPSVLKMLNYLKHTEKY